MSNARPRRAPNSLTDIKLAALLKEREEAYLKQHKKWDPLDAFFYKGSQLPGMYFKVECNEEENVVLEPDRLQEALRGTRVLAPIKFSSKTGARPAPKASTVATNYYRIHAFVGDTEYEPKFATLVHIAFSDTRFLKSTTEESYDKLSIGMSMSDENPGAVALHYCLEKLEEIREALAKTEKFKIGGSGGEIQGSNRRTRPGSPLEVYLARLNLYYDKGRATLLGVQQLVVQEGPAVQDRDARYVQGGVSIPIQGNLRTTDRFLGISGSKVMRCTLDFSGIRTMFVYSTRFFLLDLRIRGSLQIVAFPSSGAQLSTEDEEHLAASMRELVSKYEPAPAVTLNVDDDDDESEYSLTSQQMSQLNI